MKPIHFKQTEPNEIYMLQFTDDDNLITKTNIKKPLLCYKDKSGKYIFDDDFDDTIKYKVKITKREEPLEKTQLDFDYEKRLADNCERCMNELLELNFIKAIEDYRQYLEEVEDEHNEFIKCYKTIKKLYEELYNFKYISSKSDKKIYYSIHIDILNTGSIYFNVNCRSDLWLKDTILENIVDEFRTYYHRKDEILWRRRVWEIIDEIIFKIGDKLYQYDVVTNNMFYNNKYNNAIMCITTEQKIGDNDLYGYIINHGKKEYLYKLSIDNQTLIYLDVKSSINAKNGNFIKKLDMCPKYEELLYNKFNAKPKSYVYQYTNEITFYEADVENSYSEILKKIHEHLFNKTFDDFCYKILIPIPGKAYRREQK